VSQLVTAGVVSTRVQSL